MTQDSGIGATPTTCTSSSVTTATPTKATPKKRKRFKLKKFLRKSRDPEKQQQQQQQEKENKDLQQQTQSLPVNGKHPKGGSLQASGSHSPHGRHSRRNNGECVLAMIEKNTSSIESLLLVLKYMYF